MLAGWRHAYANSALTGGNLLFLLIALKFPTPAGVGLAAGLVGATSLLAWHRNLARYSAVADTPTSRIASAPLGYVEIFGKGVHPPPSASSARTRGCHAFGTVTSSRKESAANGGALPKACPRSHSASTTAAAWH